MRNSTMKVYHNPTVRIIGRSEKVWEGIDSFIAAEYGGTDLNGPGREWEGDKTDSSPDAEVITEFSGRLCYMSFDKPRPGGSKAYINHIKEVGHGSVLEHASWSFLITGISRTCTHELVRHRAGWAYSQLSQRYVDESVAEYVEPDIIKNDPELHKLWTIAVASAHDAYLTLVDGITEKIMVNPAMLGPQSPTSGLERRKAARQAARSVLPNATETKIVATANARACRHFLEIRGSRHAEPEIRKVAYAMYELLVKESPLLFSDYKVTELPDGTRELTTDFKKV